MAKLRLTEEEKLALIEALNNDIEPDPDLVPKLFPSTAEKFDVISLDRAKVPTLEYAGKRSKAAILAEASAGIGAAPLQTVRCFGEAKEDEWKNLIVQGDNLQFLKTCYRNEDPLIKDKVKGHVKLIYIDPPFATKSDFGGNDGEKSYTDKVITAEFVESVRERLIFFRELLHPEGSIFVHLDSKMSHYIKVALDDVFGKNNYLNEIIWQKTKPKSSTPTGKVHDTLHWYARDINRVDLKTIYTDHDEDYVAKTYKYSDEGGRYAWVTLDAPGQGESRKFGDITLAPPKGRHWAWSQEKIDQEYQRGNIKLGSKGAAYQKRYLGKTDGQVVGSLWIDPEVRIGIMSSSNESCDYPTQKPERLINRVIEASSNRGDLVMDCFAGSGTTPSVAEKLGRRWIACDFGKHAVYTMQRRILRIGESSALEEERGEDGKIKIKKGDAYNKSAKPFCVLSSGAYDFSHVMELREHKDRYVNFVLGLFQLSKDEEIGKKFKSDIIFAEKSGHPVEVYPIWKDEFLKEVRIDEEYLEGILTQSGGKLKGEYYIITPETCTNVGDTTLKNDNGDEITFKMLTFPYKVLEDVSRKLTLQDQPSKPEDVNQLISSTAFYFNEDVEIAVKRTDAGLQITHFDTKILDGQGNRFPGYNGLAMLLVDNNYESGKPFDMDKTVFLKDVKEDGSVALPDLSSSVGVIAIDKHGNESKPVRVD